MIEIDFTTKPEIAPEYFVDKSGAKYLYDDNRKYHSYNDLPAVIYSDGSKFWFKHGLIHRNNNLPAVVRYNGLKVWYENRIRIK